MDNQKEEVVVDVIWMESSFRSHSPSNSNSLIGAICDTSRRYWGKLASKQGLRHFIWILVIKKYNGVIPFSLYLLGEEMDLRNECLDYKIILDDGGEKRTVVEFVSPP